MSVDLSEPLRRLRTRLEGALADLREMPFSGGSLSAKKLEERLLPALEDVRQLEEMADPPPEDKPSELTTARALLGVPFPAPERPWRSWEQLTDAERLAILRGPNPPGAYDAALLLWRLPPGGPWQSADPKLIAD
jgi:hypothetical protein